MNMLTEIPMIILKYKYYIFFNGFYRYLFVRSSIIESSFIVIRRIWIFAGNITAFCLDIIQE